MLQPRNGGLGVQQDSERSLIFQFPCYLDSWSAWTTPRKSASKTSYPLPNGIPFIFQDLPGSCHAISALYLPFSNLEPSDQIASLGERDCAAARASGPDSISNWPGNSLLVACIALSKPSDGSAGRMLANCRARCCPRDHGLRLLLSAYFQGLHMFWSRIKLHPQDYHGNHFNLLTEQKVEKP